MIEKLKPYPAYKDSGVEWLGEMPAHWEVRRGKTILRPIDVRSSTGKEEILTVSSERGVVPRSTATVTMFKAESYIGYKLCWPGDLVINSLWAWAQGLGVSSYHGIVSSAYGVYRLKNENEVSSQYIHELVRSVPFQWELQVRSKGIWISRLQLTDEAFLRAPFPLPPLSEQTAIVRFLDYMDRRIRRYIRAKQRLIKLLEEYKQALIHQAVTGQMDVRTGEPYPAYKDSGVEWLGKVPEHWETCRLKSRLVKNDSGIWRDHHDPDGTIILRSTEQTVSGGWKIENPARLHLSHMEREAYLLQVGDLVVTKSSGSPDHIGKTSLVTEDVAALGCAFSNFMQRLRLGENTDPKLVWYYLNSPIGREQLVFQSTTTTGLGNLNGKILGNCVIALPPLSEQTAIVEYLDTQTAKIDAAMAAARREIELLREYRTRLIADVVTGKVDVREVAAQLPEEPPEEGEWMDTEEAVEGEAADDEAVAETFSEEEVAR
jgi:type I restriction enzyme S subunit